MWLHKRERERTRKRKREREEQSSRDKVMCVSCDPLWEKVHFRAKIRNCVMHTVRTRVTLALR